jgi:hypothetical protein
MALLFLLGALNEPLTHLSEPNQRQPPRRAGNVVLENYPQHPSRDTQQHCLHRKP